MKNSVRRNNRRQTLFRETPKKSEISLRQAERFLLPVIAVVCLFFVASCGVLMRPFRSEYNANVSVADTNANAANLSNTSSFDEGKFKRLLDKTREIEQLSLPVKLDPKAVIKGKVFFVTNPEAGGHKYEQYISDYRKARNLEELETVIRIVCSKGKFLGSYKEVSYDAYQTAKAYGLNCQVSLIDYPGRVVVAQKNFSNNRQPEVISGKKVGARDEYLNPPPIGDIARFIDNFDVDKVLPTMTDADEKELVRLPVTVNLKPDAAIKGKIKIAQKSEEGYDSSDSSAITINSFDDYGLPSEKRAYKSEDLETLIKIVCVKGVPIGKVGQSAQISNKCEVSLIDYKTLSVFAQKVIENKTLDESRATESSEVWIVRPPKKEIESYLKSFPIL